MKPNRIFILALLLVGMRANAQSRLYLPDTGIKVFAYGQQQTLAWCGGFDNPQFAMGDLNHDGLQDLVVYERYEKVSTFINKGTAGSPHYVYAPEYAFNFPPVMGYLILADYNCDGIPDLFDQGMTGFEAYKGYYNSANQLCFTYYKALFSGSENLYNCPADIPAIVDVDNDGDLDFLSYSITAGSLQLYQNVRVEWGLPCDSIVTELIDNCWGKYKETYFDTFLMNYECFFPPSGTMGNTPCLFDYDMDGDYDYLGGCVSANTLRFGLNGRLPYHPSGPDSLVSQYIWPSGGVALNLPSWPAAFNVDIDQDGKKDLLVAPNNRGQNYNCVWYYENHSTPGVPDWRLQSDSFLVDKSIDLGSGAYPMLYDYNKDGKPDLLIGSWGYYQDSNGTARSRMSYYQNTGTAGNPAFTLQTRDFLELDSFDFQGAAPAVGDIDNDGKDDLIIGHADGTLSYFKNTAATGASQPVWQLAQLALTDVDGDTIDVGEYAAPFVYDGKKDLLLGSRAGYVQYYRNVATTAGSVKLALVSTRLGNANADPADFTNNFSVPFVGKIDSTGTDYLLLGSHSGAIYRYGGIASGDTTLAYTLLDSQYSYIDTTFNTYCHEHQGSNRLAVNFSSYNSTVAVGDIAGDGSRYMIIGNARGGLELYHQALENNIAAVSQPLNPAKVTLWPNPANDMLRISCSGMAQPTVLASISNAAGQQLCAATFASGSAATISVAALPPGLYICMLQNGETRYYCKFAIVR